MTSNHTRFSHSVNNLRFCTRVSPLKQDHSKSLNVTNGNQQHAQKRAAVGMATKHCDLPGGKSINLPPVDVGRNHNPQSKNCFAVDLLQLANGCSRVPERNSKEGKRRANCGTRSAGQSSDGSAGHRRCLLPRPSFQASVASAPESCRKQSNATSKNFPRRLNDKIREQESDFAKSWPLAPHVGGRSTSRLPLIGGNERKLNEHRPITGKQNDLAGGLSKFNQGRNFRMRRFKTSHETENHKATTNADVISSPRVVMETLTELTISQSPAQPQVVYNLSSAHKPGRDSSSDSSDLTTVTAESTRVHPDDGAPEPGDDDSDERDELDRKCIQWLEDVARERLQNPEKVFLPHLLMS